MLHQYNSSDGGCSQTADNRDEVLFGQIGGLDAADGSDWDTAPGDDGTAADPDGGNLTECGEGCDIDRASCGEGLRECTAQRQAGEARAVQTGDCTDGGFQNGDRSAGQRDVLGQPQTDITEQTARIRAQNGLGKALAAKEEESRDDDDRGENLDGEDEAVAQVIGGDLECISDAVVGDGGDRHENKRSTCDQRGRVAARDAKTHHQTDIKQQSCRNEDGNSDCQTRALDGTAEVVQFDGGKAGILLEVAVHEEKCDGEGGNTHNRPQGQAGTHDCHRVHAGGGGGDIGCALDEEVGRQTGTVAE